MPSRASLKTAARSPAPTPGRMRIASASLHASCLLPAGTVDGVPGPMSYYAGGLFNGCTTLLFG
jgi:hypothetical protein